MKKLMCILLAVLLASSAGITVPAEGSDPEAADPYVIDKPELGFHFEIPEKYRNLKGSLDWNSGFLDDGILQIRSSYYAFPEEDFDEYNDYINAWMDAMVKEEDPPVPADPKWATQRECAYLYDIFIINAGRGEEELREELKAHNGIREDDFSWFEKLGSDGEFSFFIGQYAELDEGKEEYREAMGEEYFNEFQDIAADHETFVNALTLRAPEFEQINTDAGEVLSFETTDLEGNPVTSQELFAGSKVTMLNFWATWCAACKKEMRQLEELSKEFEKNGCQIVGMCIDADEEGMDEAAREILAEYGVDYLNLAPPEDMEEVLPTLISLPTSFFIDSEGRMIAEPVRGAHVEEYLPALNDALAKLGAE